METESKLLGKRVVFAPFTLLSRECDGELSGWGRYRIEYSEHVKNSAWQTGYIELNDSHVDFMFAEFD